MSSTPGLANTPEFASAFAALSVVSFKREMGTTRKVIAAAADAQRDYRPDPKSRTAFELAWHLASGDVMFLESIAAGRFSTEQPSPVEPSSFGAMAEWYAVNVAAALEKVAKLSGEQLAATVDFFGVTTLPLYQVLPIANNHSVHHRGQLAAYLRAMGAKVPSIYGGSADEPWKG